MYKLRTLSITLALLTPVLLAGCGGFYASGDDNYFEDEAAVGFFGPDLFLDGGYFGGGGGDHGGHHEGGMGHMGGGGMGGHGGHH